MPPGDLTIGHAQRTPACRGCSLTRPRAAEARARRLQWPAGIMAQAEAEIEKGLGIDDEAAEAWLDQLERGHRA